MKPADQDPLCYFFFIHMVKNEIVQLDWLEMEVDITFTN